MRIRLFGFVDPSITVGVIIVKFLVIEPKFDLGLCGFYGIGSVDDILASDDREVTTNSARSGCEGISGTDHCATYSTQKRYGDLLESEMRNVI